MQSRALPLFLFSLFVSVPAFPMVGGSPVQPSETLVKHMVYIGKTGGTKNCGGILLTNDFILTASHCTHHLEENEVYVISTAAAGKPCGRARSRQIFIHPKAVKTDFIGVLLPDIALVKLASPICGSQPLDPSRQIQEFQAGQTYHVAGYGIGTKENAVYPDRLDALFEGGAEGLLNKYYSDLKTSDPEYYLGVQRLMKEAGAHEFLLTPLGSGKAVCGGDSGSPIYRTSAGELILSGINSLAIPHSARGVYDCNDSFLLGAARLSPYLDWILATVRN